MDEIVLHITLADGTEFDAIKDDIGNLIVNSIEEETLSADNLSSVNVDENGVYSYTLSNQVLRLFRIIAEGKVLINFSDMTSVERMEAEYNAKLDYIACMTGVDLDE